MTERFRPTLVSAILVLAAAVMLTLGGDAHPPLPGQAQGGRAMTFTLTTQAFPTGGEIPAKYTCTGADVSPALAWSGTPAQSQALALIMDDPDAPSGTFTHWLLYDIAATATSLPENVSKTGEAPGIGRQGQNGFGRAGYGGPCPPPGKPHRYYFRLYALDRKLELKPGASRRELEQAMEGHVLGHADLMGTFKR